MIEQYLSNNNETVIVAFCQKKKKLPTKQQSVVFRIADDGALSLQSVVFESYHIQGGTDRTGVPTKMMSVNATVRLRFRNRGTFFSLHVTATPFLLFYGDLTVASGDVRTISI
jgi:hypothetical protein